MFGLGPMELMIVGVVAVLLFGKRLPEVGRSMGKSIVEFKKGMRDGEEGGDAGQEKLAT
jgi:sec-independent protein translocase protein TatA